MQPPLYEMLVPHQLDILAPVFDGLFLAFCNALQRPILPGCGANLSPDEKAVAAFIIWPIAAEDTVPLALSHAAASAQAMLLLAQAEATTCKVT